MNVKDIAKELCRKAEAKLLDDKNDWQGKQSMIDMFVEDCKDAKRVANHIAKSELEESMILLSKFDTASREIIFDMIVRTDKAFAMQLI